MNTYSKTHDEQDYFNEYKKIRNKFRTYNSLQLIYQALRYLKYPTKNRLDEHKKQPWLVTLFIKWVLLDRTLLSTNGKNPDQRDLNKLLQRMLDLGGKARLPSQFDHYSLFFRAISYQQFLYQFEFQPSLLARQHFLFCPLDKNHFIKRSFEQETGIEIQTFLEISLIASVSIEKHRSLFSLSPLFAQLSEAYGKTTIDKYLDAISSTLPTLQEKLSKDDERLRRSSEYYEQSPLISWPLLLVDKHVICIYPELFYRCVEHYIYDRIKSYDHITFMAKFGRIFESYVEKSIHSTNLPYINEGQVKSILGDSGGQIDFIIEDSDSHIFVDAKGVEMSHKGKVTHLSNILKGATKSSILKAIKQAHEVLKKISGANSGNDLIQPKTNNFLLVVTYKELYLGNGKTFYNAVAKENIDEIYGKYDRQIPLENMYFITIEELDIFCSLIRNKAIGLSEGLAKARSSDREPEKRKFDFMLHLRSWSENFETPQHLIDSLNALKLGVKNSLPEK